MAALPRGPFSLLALALALSAAPAALAADGSPTAAIGPSARLAASRLAVTVSGTVTCAKTDHASVVVDLVQASTGAYATGAFPPPAAKGSAAAKANQKATRCTGAPIRWTVVAASAGKAPVRLAPGSARACTIVRLRRHVKTSSLWVSLGAVCRTIRIR